jgi:hypothetical protein
MSVTLQSIGIIVLETFFAVRQTEGNRMNNVQRLFSILCSVTDCYSTQYKPTKCTFSKLIF